VSKNKGMSTTGNTGEETPAAVAARKRDDWMERALASAPPSTAKQTRYVRELLLRLSK
jgi:hypothetical protein